MTAARPGDRSGSSTPTLGGFTTGQLVRLCDVVGLEPADAEIYARVLIEALGPSAERPLDRPPPSESLLSDDHTPVEFSLSFLPDAVPTLRLLLEPGCGAHGPTQSGRTGLRVVREMAQRWDIATGQLDELEDLFFPASAEGPFALWCALELRPGGVPRVKVYLNPAASGQEHSAGTVREAMRRLGHPRAFASLPEADGYPYFALDLGDWDTPRAKVYLRHDDLSAAEAGRLPRTSPGHVGCAETEEFFRTAAGLGAGPGENAVLGGGRTQSCHAFTETASGLASGFTLYVPVRDSVGHDGEALARAEAVLERRGVDTAPLLRSLEAVTSRLPQDGVGLIAYLSLTHHRGRPPRVNAYISSEAYAVRPPVTRRHHQVEMVH
ncbi:tryptophan dimethylallyltransferase family protein [Streptomyces sp. NPDC127595]|uniref:tryptophan dimethylallyltransferase family protein n=1 Tax=Streptomyces sp. NPDC127595 TaxID=3345405 RepID=UPI003635E92E